MKRILRNAIFSAFGIAGVFVGSYLGTGTLNPTKWVEVVRDDKRENQEYSTLVDEVTQCVNRDNIEGYSFNELNELYRRAGVELNLEETSFNINFQAGWINTSTGAIIEVPKLTKQDLQKVVESCEAEGER